jgi:hypothetical protein
MVFWMPLGLALISSSIKGLIYFGTRFFLLSAFAFTAIRLNDNYIRKTLKSARTHWNPVYENYVPQPEQGASYWRNPEALNIPKVQRRGRNTIYIATGMILIFLMGYGSHDLRFYLTRHKYDDVQVVNRYDSNHFKVHPARMDSFDWTTCSPVDWQPNQRMKFVHYSQMVGCKDVTMHGAYKFYEENGRRKIYPKEIQNGAFQASAR